MIPASTAEFDAVATDDIRIESREEAQAWLFYSITELQPRSLVLQRAAGRLMLNPFLYFRWRKAQRLWEANTARQQAILTANQRWVRASSASAMLQSTGAESEETP